MSLNAAEIIHSRLIRFGIAVAIAGGSALAGCRPIEDPGITALKVRATAVTARTATVATHQTEAAIRDPQVQSDIKVRKMQVEATVAAQRTEAQKETDRQLAEAYKTKLQNNGLAVVDVRIIRESRQPFSQVTAENGVNVRELPHPSAPLCEGKVYLRGQLLSSGELNHNLIILVGVPKDTGEIIFYFYARTSEDNYACVFGDGRANIQ